MMVHKYYFEELPKNILKMDASLKNKQALANKMKSEN